MTIGPVVASETSPMLKSRCRNRPLPTTLPPSLPAFSALVSRSPQPHHGRQQRFINVDADRVVPLSGMSNDKRNQRHRKKNEKRQRGTNSKQSYRFVDRTRIKVTGGSGGNGSLSVYKISRGHKRRPDGGHGGHGGSVIIVADPNEQSLRWTQPHVFGKDGVHGQGQEKHGRNGRNTILRVPCGVIVRRILDVDEYLCEETKEVKKLVPAKSNDDIDDFSDSMEDEAWNSKYESTSNPSAGGYLASNDYDSDEEDDDDEDFNHDDSDSDDNNPDSYHYYDDIHASPNLSSYVAWGDQEKVDIADLDLPGSHVVVARGGRGGFGSSIFASRGGPMPPPDVLARYAKPKPGETARLELELKLIADVGLVGYPNAGKSSLLAATSRATPHIAPYPFTTLNPLVGHIEYRDGFRVVMCDVPGLISGASEGRGQGTDFLRHLERTKALLYVVDAAGVDGRDPATDFGSLIHELSQYANGDMLQRKCLVVANKVDLLHPEEREAVVETLREMSREAGLVLAEDVFGISAGVTGEGLGRLTKSIRQIIMSIQQ